MIKKAVRMKLYPGFKEEYARRHNELWPEMRQMLNDHGAISYSIFLDPETDYLFGYLEIEDEVKWAETADTTINRKWWDFMADVMETNSDNSPVAVDLEQVFEL
ncbi:L-rhamnose mutarotase [Enterococcus xiangfangensis]|uniref:L-rhamnose mutarotase n=1 Tax=Enterococcus xiangfangensis TaxID=1296537 RepID=A0ABU3F7Q0_9ENTE|nr:L-rhamnose mutarotase [Enterococcus xiangfangensis]MDT2758698.1 L-rhamnose mutarotase [Enterococcus xiangfangensis]